MSLSAGQVGGVVVGSTLGLIAGFNAAQATLALPSEHGRGPNTILAGLAGTGFVSLFSFPLAIADRVPGAAPQLSASSYRALGAVGATLFPAFLVGGMIGMVGSIVD